MSQSGEREIFLEVYPTLHQSSSVAAELLGRLYGGNQAVLERLGGKEWAKLKEHHRELQKMGIVPIGELALEIEIAEREEVWRFDHEVYKATRYFSIESICEGWPDSEEARILFDSARRQQWQIKGGDWFSIAERVSSAQKIADQLSIYIEKVAEADDFDRDRNARQVLRTSRRRLRIDETLAELLWDKLNASPSSGEKVNLPALLLHAPSHSQKTKEWSASEIESQKTLSLAGVVPLEVGYDLRANALRPILLALLDVAL